MIILNRLTQTRQCDCLLLFFIFSDLDFASLNKTKQKPRVIQKENIMIHTKEKRGRGGCESESAKDRLLSAYFNYRDSESYNYIRGFFPPSEVWAFKFKGHKKPENLLVVDAKLHQDPSMRWHGIGRMIWQTVCMCDTTLH